MIQASRVGDRRTWLLETVHTALVISVDASDVLRQEHWGARSPGSDATAYLTARRHSRPSQREFLDGDALAYPVYGDPTFKEPCLCVVYADGVRLARLHFVEAREGGTDLQPTLEVSFEDAAYGLRVTHEFEVVATHDVVRRTVRLTNLGTDPIRIERALSAALPFEPGSYEAWTLHGQWGREYQLERRPLGPGKLVVESRRGFTSAEANPWFALARRGEATETEGAVWFGALAWSGSWSMVFEVEASGTLSVVAGVQPFDFGWQLGAGEELVTPTLVTGYSEAGLDGASAVLRRFVVEQVLPTSHAGEPRPVLYNSWEATNFAVSAEHQMALARRAAAMGVELFVVDDGWFGSRESDRAALGDWTVDPRKFPRGLNELSEVVHGLGMRFGLWVEPEMVNPDSDLYRAHPDWTFHFPNREPSLWRNQLVLNFARVDVRRSILGQLQALLRGSAIDFLKWDHNRPLTEVGWPEAPLERQREAWMRHVRGVYEVFAVLRSEFPNLSIESCASGGGRADLGILRYADQVWTSDNTDAADRLTIQYGYSRAYPARTMVNWVTDVPNQQTGRTSPLRFRFHVAMQGVLGIGGDIGRWSEGERAEASVLIEDYLRIRPIVQLGTQHWLVPPAPLGASAVQYVSEAREATVLLAYQVRGVLGAGGRHLRLRGLDPRRVYRHRSDGVEITGAALMAGGVPVHLVGDWQSELQEWSAR